MDLWGRRPRGRVRPRGVLLRSSWEADERCTLIFMYCGRSAGHVWFVRGLPIKADNAGCLWFSWRVFLCALCVLARLFCRFGKRKIRTLAKTQRAQRKNAKEERIGHGTGRCPFSVRIRKLRFWFLLCVSSEKITDLPGNRDGPKLGWVVEQTPASARDARSRSCSHWWRPMPPTFIFYGWPEPAMSGLSAFICGQFSCSKNQNGRR